MPFRKVLVSPRGRISTVFDEEEDALAQESIVTSLVGVAIGTVRIRTYFVEVKFPLDKYDLSPPEVLTVPKTACSEPLISSAVVVSPLMVADATPNVSSVPFPDTSKAIVGASSIAPTEFDC